MTKAPAARIRVLVVDGDATARQALARQLAEHAAIEVVGTAINARTAMPKAVTYLPDVITVDMVSNEVEGLGLVEALREKGKQIGVVMMAANPAAAQSLRSRRDLAPSVVLLRHDGSTPATDSSGRQLAQAVLQLAASEARSRETGAAAEVVARKSPAEPARAKTPKPMPAAASRKGGAQIVGIGTSTGGPNALSSMLPMLPAGFPLPILIVQHMPPGFTASLAQSLSRICKLPVREAIDGEAVRAGQVLIAPGGKHLRVIRSDDGVVTQITEDPPENSCRPAVDYLFRSLREVYGASTIAVIMTGMGEDGLAGCQQLRAAGAWLVAQDAASCTVYGMPRGPIESGIVDVVAPLGGLAAQICDAAGIGDSSCN